MNIDQESLEYLPFDTTTIKPKDVKNVLSKSNLKSAPGHDGIPYSALLKLKSSHHILATLYNKVFVMGSPPDSWYGSMFKLAHKKDSKEDPKNFRMLALTGYIGKCFHLLLAMRLTTYLTSNNLY